MPVVFSDTLLNSQYLYHKPRVSIISLKVKRLIIVIASIAALLVLGVLAIKFFLPGSPKALIPSKTETSIGFDQPIIIKKGGIYSGNWESKDSEVPAVEIRTSEPVIIENSTIRGAGYLIKSEGHDAKIIVRNTEGYGLPPTPWVLYEKPRRFLIVNDFKHVVVENCYMESTAGIYLGNSYKGNGSPQQTISIRYNKAKNIDGRIYDGWYRSQFVQFNFRNPVQHAEIAWNEIINKPDQSLVEDNINIYNSRGTAASPIRIHNNYIQGAYPLPATNPEYSGGGILTDAPAEDTTQTTAHVRIYENQLVGLGNYCIGIAGGNNIEVYRNRAMVSGMIDADRPFACWTSGIWAKDFYKTGATFGNRFYNNTLGVVGQGGEWRNEIMEGIENAASIKDNQVIQQHPSANLEQEERKRWQEKIQSNGIAIGPIPIPSR
jgi:hypothetical protein